MIFNREGREATREGQSRPINDLFLNSLASERFHPAVPIAHPQEHPRASAQKPWLLPQCETRDTGNFLD